MGTEQMRQMQLAMTKLIFDELIDRHAEAYLEAYPEIVEFSSFERSGSYKRYIGMVWTNNFERPDTQQLKIRGSHSLTGNKLIELDLTKIDGQHTFFPGQIIAFQAEPFLKRQLTVKKLYDPIRIAPPTKRIDCVDKIRLIIAAGPFMKPEQEDWSLYNKLIEHIKTNRASHVILMGPLVDLENKNAKLNFVEHWRLIVDRLTNELYDIDCRVYLVPSSRDILPAFLGSNYFHPCPQPALKLKPADGNLKPKLQVIGVGDPAQIDLGGLYVDVTSAEVLLHLNKCVSFINKGPGNSFTPLFRHLLTQGLYPIHPPPNDMAVDYPKLSKHIQLDRLGPHIVVMPTRFNTSVVDVENRVVVAVQKCSVKRHLVMIDIPKIESSQGMDSLVVAGYRHEIIDLLPAKEAASNSQVTGEPTATNPTEIQSETSQPLSTTPAGHAVEASGGEEC